MITGPYRFFLVIIDQHLELLLSSADCRYMTRGYRTAHIVHAHTIDSTYEFINSSAIREVVTQECLNNSPLFGGLYAEWTVQFQGVFESARSGKLVTTRSLI